MTLRSPCYWARSSAEWACWAPRHDRLRHRRIRSGRHRQRHRKRCDRHSHPRARPEEGESPSLRRRSRRSPRRRQPGILPRRSPRGPDLGAPRPRRRGKRRSGCARTREANDARRGPRSTSMAQPAHDLRSAPRRHVLDVPSRCQRDATHSRSKGHPHSSTTGPTYPSQSPSVMKPRAGLPRDRRQAFSTSLIRFSACSPRGCDLSRSNGALK